MLTSQRKSQQHGVSMIEALVAIVITTLGVLGVIGVQMRTLTDTQSGSRRAQSIQFIQDLSERMQSNPDAISNISAYASVPVDQGTDCTSTPCSPAALAQYEIFNWRAKVVRDLPADDVQVFVPLNGPRQLAVLIGWRESQVGVGGTARSASETEKIDGLGGTTYKDATNASITTKAGLTYHLQFIQPAQRCTPWANGSGILYCPN